MTPIDACSSCTAIARALLREAQMFGSRIARETAVPKRVCADHLPLVVGLTAPRELSKWLLFSLEERSRDSFAFLKEPCPLCEADLRARHDLPSVPPAGIACPEHGGIADTRFEVLSDRLARIAAGERLPPEEERRALRAALVLYASSRGTGAYIPRID